MEDKMSDSNTPCLDDFVSLKKCLVGLYEEYLKDTLKQKDLKYESSPLKYMAKYLVKLMKTYPLTQSVILKLL